MHERVVYRVVGFYLALASGFAGPTLAAEAGLEAAIREIGERYVGASGGVGLSIGLVADGQRRIHHFGRTAVESRKTPTDRTVYEIGSVSKTFVDLLLAQAVVEKRVRLQDDVRQYLDGAYDNLQFDGQPVRLVHLANMTAALPDNLPDMTAARSKTAPADIPALMVHTLGPYTRDQFLGDLHQVHLSKRPGEEPVHSNASIQLLSLVLEKVYGDSFENLVTQKIETPLGMESGEAPPADQIAEGYDDRGVAAPPMTMKCVLAAGGLRYGAADMFNYVAHHLAESDEAVKLTHAPTWFTLDRKMSLGLPWIMSDEPGHRRLRYSGGTFGFSSCCDLYPDEGVGLILLANNSDRQSQDKLQAAAEQIMAEIRRQRAVH